MGTIIDISDRFRSSEDFAGIEQALRSRGADDELIAFAVDLCRSIKAKVQEAGRYDFNVGLPAELSQPMRESIEREIRDGAEQIANGSGAVVEWLIGKLVMSELHRFQYKRLVEGG